MIPSKSKIALLIGIISGLVFLVGLFIGVNDDLDIMPIILFFIVIISVVFQLLFNKKIKQE